MTEYYKLKLKVQRGDTIKSKLGFLIPITELSKEDEGKMWICTTLKIGEKGVCKVEKDKGMVTKEE